MYERTVKDDHTLLALKITKMGIDIYGDRKRNFMRSGVWGLPIRDAE